MQRSFVLLERADLWFDPPTGLKSVVQIHVASAGDYYPIDESIRQRRD
jgi:hypothetical protein